MGRRHENRYGRGGHYRGRDHADDRGYAERAGDEVRSWFGDDEAQRRRYADEQRDRERESHYTSEGNRSDWDRDRGNWNRYESRPDWDRSESRRADWNRSDWNQHDWNRSDVNRADWNRGDWNRGDWRDRGGWDQTNWRSPEPRSAGALRHRSWGGASAGTEWSRNPAQDWERNRSGLRGQEGTWGDRDYGSRINEPGREWSVDEGRTDFDQRYGRGPKGYHRSDARIFEDVCDRLTYSDVDAENIEVRVENGEVTLSGSVRDRSDKRRAEDVAEEVSGVRDVHNNIRVHREDRGIGQSEKSASDQPGTVLGVNPTQSSSIANTPPKGSTRS